MTAPYVYEFGRFRLDPGERALLREQIPIALTEKAFQVLLVLVTRSGHLVERSELVEAVWGDAFVEDGNLTVTVSMLRKALGDDRGKNKVIETVAKRGYRFLPPVTRLPVQSSSFRNTATESEGSERQHRAIPELVEAGRSRGLYIGVVAVLLAVSVTAALVHRHARSIGPAPNAASSVTRFVLVAPFNMAGSDSANRQIGVTIASDLVGKLGRNERLKAQSVSDLPRYLRSDSSGPSTQAREVDVLLTGQVKAVQGNLRVDAKLSNTEGETLWSGTYETALGNLPGLEDQIESSVGKRMLAPGPVPQLTQPIYDIEAQRLYVAGRYFWDERTEIGLRRSIECFQQAIFRDPKFAEAYAGLADSYVLLGSYGVEPPAEAYPNAKAAALKALQLNAGLAEGHTALGMVALFYEWNWQAAEQEFRKAIDLAPDYSAGYTWDSLYLAAVGQTSRALQQAQKARQIDPMSMAAILHLGSAYYWDRQYTKAAETYRYALTRDATFSFAHSRLGMVLTAQKDYPRAIQQFRETERLSGSDPYTDGLIGYAEALRGNTRATRKILDDLTARSQREYIPAFSFAILYLGLGDRDKAFDWLNRARQDRSTYLVYAKVAPLLDPLRSDQRFNLLLENMGLQAARVVESQQTSDSSKSEMAQTSSIISHRSRSTSAAIDQRSVQDLALFSPPSH